MGYGQLCHEPALCWKSLTQNRPLDQTEYIVSEMTMKTNCILNMKTKRETCSG